MKMRIIDVSSRQKHLRVGVRKIRQAVRAALDATDSQSCELSVALVDDAQIREVNRQYLDHDYPTDVISFDLSAEADASGTGQQVDRLTGPSGEIIVSAERAVAAAAEQGHEAEAELLLYVVHGVLHLLGHDDTTSAAAGRMHRLEDQIMESLGYGRTYSGRNSSKARKGESA